jgi:uncharacterized membrane protein YsdA (DUF1294 family)
MPSLILLYLGWLAVINVASAFAYAQDKRAARRSARRIPERTLFMLNLAGGVVGAWLIFFGMRHKTQHTSFWVVQSLSTVLHLALLWWLIVRVS